MRQFFAASVFTSVALVFSAGQTSAQTQPYPNRAIKLVVPFGAGGSLDIVARLVAAKASDDLGQIIIIENKTGADGDIGTESVARSAPDGYALLMTSHTLAVNVSLRPKRSYQIDDLAPIMLVADTQSVLCVSTSVDAKSVKDVIALAKANPGKLDYGSAGVGSSSHLATELFRIGAGIDIVHVPFRNTAQWQTDMAAGRIPIGIPTFPSAMSLLRGGKVRCLAVTGAKRSPAMPDLPTIAEAGVPGYVATSWYPLLAPRGTSEANIDRVHRAYRAALEDPTIKARLSEMGVETVGSTPAELATQIKAEVERWAKVVKQANISSQ